MHLIKTIRVFLEVAVRMQCFYLTLICSYRIFLRPLPKLGVKPQLGLNIFILKKLN
jgi:hypothetical protein